MEEVEAINTISKEMIKSVSKEIDCPLIIGGGINTSKKALEKLGAGSRYYRCRECY